MAMTTATPGSMIDASLPTIRGAFEALSSQSDAAHIAAAQTPAVLAQRIGVLRDTWQRLDAGLSQWANLLVMVRDTIRDTAMQTQPLAAAAFATLDPLLQNAVPAPDWGLAGTQPTEQMRLDLRRDAIEYLERRLALLTQFAVACESLAAQGGQGIPEELRPLLLPPFRAEPTVSTSASSSFVPPSALPQPPPGFQVQPQGMPIVEPMRPTFAPAGKTAEVVGSIREHIEGKADHAATAAARQAKALQTLLQRWSSPEEWAKLSPQEQARRSSLLQSLWDRAQHLSSGS